MKEICPKSIQEFLSLFDMYLNDCESFYRGQAKADWKLLSGLGRNENLKAKNNIIKNEKELMKSFKKMICKFSLQNLIYIQPAGYAKEWQYLMIAQHYGLPTRLIDFSDDKYYALQFAITDIENIKENGAFFVYKKDDTYKGPDDAVMQHSTHLPTSSFMFQVPKYANNNTTGNLSFRRQLIQRSKFFYIATNNIFDCLCTDKDHSANLTKVIIDKQFKLDLIKYLIDNQKFDSNPYLNKNKIDYIASILKDNFMAKNK